MFLALHRSYRFFISCYSCSRNIQVVLQYSHDLVSICHSVSKNVVQEEMGTKSVLRGRHLA
jgi:hypothetical protein